MTPQPLEGGWALRYGCHFFLPPCWCKHWDLEVSRSWGCPLPLPRPCHKSLEATRWEIQAVKRHWREGFTSTLVLIKYHTRPQPGAFIVPGFCALGGHRPLRVSGAE